MSGKVALALILAAGIAVSSLHGQQPDALQMFRDGQFNEAVQTTLREIAEMPRNMDAYTVLGWSLLELRRFEEALDYGTRALAISPFDPRIIHIVATAQFNLGRDLEALRHLEQYAQILPNGNQIGPVYQMMGEIFIRMGEFHHADIALTTAVHHRPNNALWWSRLGFARERAGDLPHALAAYERALQLSPGLQAAAQGRSRVRQQLPTS